jgi:hypothetical protein
MYVDSVARFRLRNLTQSMDVEENEATFSSLDLMDEGETVCTSKAHINVTCSGLRKIPTSRSRKEISIFFGSQKGNQVTTLFRGRLLC